MKYPLQPQLPAPKRIRPMLMNIFLAPSLSLFEVIVLRYCSPLDLLQLSKCSATIFNLLVGELSACWSLARGRLHELPPPPHVSVSGHWTELEYVDYLFGSSPCILCSRPCTGLPFIFALRFRVCSSFCASNLDDLNNGESYIKLEHWTTLMASLEPRGDELGLRSWIPARFPDNFIPEDAVTATEAELGQATLLDAGTRVEKPRFIQRTVEQLGIEWCRRKESWPSILQNHNELVLWKNRYLNSLTAVRQKHNEIIKKFARECGLTADIHRTPTLQKYRRCFEQDRRLLDWKTLDSL
ncbi:hypothetical protein B0H11DRAFT_2279284, partial [Mycena galericulata]